MNREIKFRVYSDELKEMIYPDKESKYTFNVWGDGTPNIYEGYRELYDFDAIVMQFTGLHDKNGVPIYEGDILESEGLNRNLYNEVFYYKEYGCFEAKPLSSNYWKTIRAENFYQFEVVGNKYSNSELLK